MKYKADNLVLDTGLHELFRDGEAVAVEPLVFDLLIYLVENQDRVVTRGELLDEVLKGRADGPLTVGSCVEVEFDDGEVEEIETEPDRKCKS